MVKKTTGDVMLEIAELSMGRLTCHVVGTTPMFMNRFSKKAREQLLFPKGRANAAERADSLKHDPVHEFRDSIYMNRNDKDPTAVHMPDGAFQKALASAALDLPGASKSQILRLVSIGTQQINLYGVPRLTMDMTRSSDAARTPDVRTRAAFPEWACKLEIEYVSTLLKQNQIVNLLAAAGVIVGIGDWRPQKGGSFGKFKVVSADDPDYIRITKTGGRAVQLDAIKTPVALNQDTEELLTWFHSEAERREKVIPSTGKTTKSEKTPKVPVAVAAKGNGRGSEAH